MKKSEAQFELRQRQSKWAIIFIVLRFLRKLIGQLWPILLAFFVGSNAQTGWEKYELIAAGFGGFSLISSVIAYFKYYYHISDDELVIESGLFKKVKLNLPFERIQSINFNQSILHQLLNVTAVEIESAGSNQKELRIDALSIESAEALRSLLLLKKEAATELEREIDEVLIEEKQEKILELSTRDLIKVGLTQNHLKPIGLIFGLIGSSFAYGYSFNIGIDDVFGYYQEFIFDSSFFQKIVTIAVLVPMMVLYSIITTFLRHYQLRFWRSNNRFHIIQGLLNKKQFSALDNKIQILSWSQNPLQRIIGFFHIYFRQARSSNDRAGRMSFNIPGCDIERINYVREAWIGKEAGNFDETYSISSHYFQSS